MTVLVIRWKVTCFARPTINRDGLVLQGFLELAISVLGSCSGHTLLGFSKISRVFRRALNVDKEVVFLPDTARDLRGCRRANAFIGRPERGQTFSPGASC